MDVMTSQSWKLYGYSGCPAHWNISWDDEDNWILFFLYSIHMIKWQSLFIIIISRDITMGISSVGQPVYLEKFTRGFSLCQVLFFKVHFLYPINAWSVWCIFTTRITVKYHYKVHTSQHIHFHSFAQTIQSTKTSLTTLSTDGMILATYGVF